MDIRAFLRDYPFMNSDILRLQKDLNAAIKAKENTYCTVKAAPTTRQGSSSGAISDSVFDAVQELIDRYDTVIVYFTQQINSLLDHKTLFEKVWFSVALLKKEERLVIEMRDFDRYRWPDIAKKLRYSERQCQRIHENAILKMQTEADRLTLTA